ncbi:MAG: M14 family zinc carboxypeptidase [Candidatus Glassbacteria bacterium]
MKALPALAAAILLFLSGTVLPAANLPVETAGLKWSLVRIPAAGPEIRALAVQAGIEIMAAGKDGSLEILTSPSGIQLLRDRGVAFEVLIEDYGRYLYQKNLAAGRLAAEQFATGSMGGYFSPPEIHSFIDSLRRLDTHGILSDTVVIGSSLLGNPVWTVRISSGPGGQGKPEVFYNSLIHSREGMSLMTLLYFMRFLVENYGRADSVTELVDGRDLYFIPLVNPDGYEINWQTYQSQSGFGLWRKNGRDNNGDSVLTIVEDGVDLNRNFDFQWGFDITGSSPFGTDDNYRGTQAFSEPETRAIRDFIRSKSFVTAINLHSYGPYLLNPFSYANLLTPDSVLYRRLSESLTLENGYRFGTAVATLTYPANGEFTDWEYADSLARGKIISWTLEIGTVSDGFWPKPELITPLAVKNLPLMMKLARLSGFWPEVDYLYQKNRSGVPGGYKIGLRLRNTGLSPNRGGLTVKLEGDSGAFVSLGTSQASASLPAVTELAFELNGSVSAAPAVIGIYDGDRRVRSLAVSLPLAGRLAYDVNTSGRVDIFDLLALLQAISSHYSVGQAAAAYDLNLDGRIDIFDLLALLRALNSA